MIIRIERQHSTDTIAIIHIDADNPRINQEKSFGICVFDIDRLENGDIAYSVILKNELKLDKEK